MPKSQQSRVRFWNPPTSGNWGAADDAVLNNVHKKQQNKQKSPGKKIFPSYQRWQIRPSSFFCRKNWQKWSTCTLLIHNYPCLCHRKNLKILISYLLLTYIEWKFKENLTLQPTPPPPSTCVYDDEKLEPLYIFVRKVSNFFLNICCRNRCWTPTRGWKRRDWPWWWPSQSPGSGITKSFHRNRHTEIIHFLSPILIVEHGPRLKIHTGILKLYKFVKFSSLKTCCFLV